MLVDSALEFNISLGIAVHDRVGGIINMLKGQRQRVSVMMDHSSAFILATGVLQAFPRPLAPPTATFFRNAELALNLNYRLIAWIRSGGVLCVRRSAGSPQHARRYCSADQSRNACEGCLSLSALTCEFLRICLRNPFCCWVVNSKACVAFQLLI